MTVDSFKYLPRLIAAVYEMMEIRVEHLIPWTPLPRSIRECKFGLVTSGGLHSKGDSPFDLLREKQEPTWGDPTFRRIPTDITQLDIRVSHLHVNPVFAETDFNILLPVHRFRELVEQGYIGGLADFAYSFMGYQGYPADTGAWRENYCIQVADFLRAEQVDCVLLTPS